jgi:hypothetical protein
VETLSDTVLFECNDLDAAQRLAFRLRPTWPQSVEQRDGRWLVEAELRARAGDLAVLLRDVEAWVAECVGRELWYFVDGRVYLLRTRAPA